MIAICDQELPWDLEFGLWDLTARDMVHGTSACLTRLDVGDVRITGLADMGPWRGSGTFIDRYYFP
jgi:hypothetical protein